MNTRVNLTRRIKIAGKDRYCPAVIAANGRVKPGWVLVDGKEEKHPNGNYYLDWTQDGKRKRLAVGAEAAQANTRLLRKEAELKAVAQGVAVVQENSGTDGGSNRRPIQLAVADFLEEVRLTKQPKTFKGYEIALAYFQESCPKRYMEDIEKLDLLKFSAFLT